jgi:excinuclease ABC subunit B
LRSDRSLIQTIGRAARNLNGTAILYADRVTGSMQRAMDETNRRREKQLEFNQQHGITPKGVKKQVTDILEGAYAKKVSRSKGRKVRDKTADYGFDAASMTPSQLAKELHKLENQMFEQAKNLEFEEAARTRDLLSSLKEHAFIDPA